MENMIKRIHKTIKQEQMERLKELAKKINKND